MYLSGVILSRGGQTVPGLIILILLIHINSTTPNEEGLLKRRSNSPLLSLLQQHQQKCQPQLITIPECRSFFYNYTGMPNLVQHENQEDAHRQLQSFSPLLSTMCSKKLRFFLCSVYTPMCDVKEHYFVGPCRPLCEHVQRRCSPILQAFNLDWPENLECHRFPYENQGDTMCMNGPNIKEEDQSPDIPNKQNPPPKITDKEETTINKGDIDESKYSAQEKESRRQCGQWKHAEKYIYLNDSYRCALLCNADAMFSKDDKRMAEIWMGVLASLCFLSTLFTILTFLLDPNRFRYPERPVIFLAFCYNLYSLAYFMRLIFGRNKAACEQSSSFSWGQSVLVEEGLDNVYCSLIFVLQYYFSTASSVWWLILTISWLLAACLKWADESIAKRSCYFHITAWVTPATLTFIVLVMRTVDSDELLALCGVGQHKLSSLMTFIILPNIIILSLGVIFLVTGFIAMILIRRHMQRDILRTERLEVFIVRIGLFSVLYLVPAVCVLICNIYEYYHRQAWRSAQSVNSRPNAEVFMFKTFMSLVVGITSGVWIWSFKTIQYWRNFFTRSRRKKARQMNHEEEFEENEDCCCCPLMSDNDDEQRNKKSFENVAVDKYRQQLLQPQSTCYSPFMPSAVGSEAVLHSNIPNYPQSNHLTTEDHLLLKSKQQHPTMSMQMMSMNSHSETMPHHGRPIAPSNPSYICTPNLTSTSKDHLMRTNPLANQNSTSYFH